MAVSPSMEAIVAKVKRRMTLQVGVEVGRFESAAKPENRRGKTGSRASSSMSDCSVDEEIMSSSVAVPERLVTKLVVCTCKSTLVESAC